MTLLDYLGIPSSKHYISHNTLNCVRYCYEKWNWRKRSVTQPRGTAAFFNLQCFVLKKKVLSDKQKHLVTEQQLCFSLFLFPILRFHAQTLQETKHCKFKMAVVPLAAVTVLLRGWDRGVCFEILLLFWHVPSVHPFRRKKHLQNSRYYTSSRLLPSIRWWYWGPRGSFWGIDIWQLHLSTYWRESKAANIF